ncbi:Mitochondrial distribution and morphology protein 10 [Sporothrix curviconia]|uniref:Mitochondrial distribution and morphology protein 10 n=1 Tax=Sporothrix curviconia TaxID=1260050 RepID=A0ABP0BR16_9PEZI
MSKTTPPPPESAFYPVVGDALFDERCACEDEAWEKNLLRPAGRRLLEAFVGRAMGNRGPVALEPAATANGSFNLVLKFRIGDGGVPACVVLRIQRRGYSPGPLAAEKLENEVCWMQYFEEHRIAPVPHIYSWRAEPGPLGGPDLPDPRGKVAHYVPQLAGIVLALGQPRLEKIGSITRAADGSASWAVTRRPLTYDMYMHATGIPDFPTNTWPTAPLSSAQDYKSFVADLRHQQLMSQRNTNIPGTWNEKRYFNFQEGEQIDMCRAMATAAGRVRSRQAKRLPQYAAHLGGEQKYAIVCGDLSVHDILVDPATGEIKALLDLEFTNAMPAAFAADPPVWLVTFDLDLCLNRGRLASWQALFRLCLDSFLRILEQVEAERSERGEVSDGSSLSARMRKSLSSGTYLVNHALNHCEATDILYHQMPALFPQIDLSVCAATKDATLLSPSSAMREFLSYVLESFRDATGWSRDNGYSDLNVAANELLNFPTPRGLRMSLSSLATPHFATAYTLGSMGVVDGAISYLYSSVPLSNVVAQSSRVPLPTLLRSYRQRARPMGQPPTLDAAYATPPRERLTLETILPFLASTPVPPPTTAAVPVPVPVPAPEPSDDEATTTIATPSALPSPLPTSTVLADTLLVPVADQLAAVAHEARALVDKPALLYGRLYLPRSMLEAYMVKRLAPSVQLQLRAVSDAKLPNGGTVLGIVQLDRGRYGLEGLVSSDGGLLGVRGLYNFGQGSANTATDASSSTHGSGDDDHSHGRFSAGGEIYYGTLNKSGGVSLGARFETTMGDDSGTTTASAATASTTAKHKGTPLTATLTVNPLMGNLSAAYAVVAREDCSLATRFDFNVYSYESEWSVGMELWSTRRLAGLVAVDGESVAEENGTVPAVASPAPPPAPSIAKSFGIPERSFQAKLEWRLDDPVVQSSDPTVSPTASAPTLPPTPPLVPDEAPSGEEKYQGVLKARLDQNLKIGLLWEGRIKSLLFSLGSAIDLHRPDQPFRTLGLEIQFSS